MIKKVDDGKLGLPSEQHIEGYQAAMLVAIKRLIVAVDSLIDEVEELKSQGDIPRMVPGYQNNR